MLFILAKIFVTAAIIVIVSEIAKVNDRIGGRLQPCSTTFLILFWMYYENVSKIRFFSYQLYTSIFITTVPMFIIFPFCLNKFDFDNYYH